MEKSENGKRLSEKAMKRLCIKTSSVIQGDFLFRDLNLMLVFQVNCPGCFVYSLPMAARLHSVYHENVLNVLGLSTAFEDFELNTEENTRLLVERSEVIGEAKKALNAMGHKKFPHAIEFPLAFDLVGRPGDVIGPEDIEHICDQHPELKSMTDIERDRIKTSVRMYYQNYKMIGYTFGVNLLNGTPTWVLFNREMEILDQWFGHLREDDLNNTLQRFTKA